MISPCSIPALYYSALLPDHYPSLPLHPSPFHFSIPLAPKTPASSSLKPCDMTRTFGNSLNSFGLSSSGTLVAIVVESILRHTAMFFKGGNLILKGKNCSYQRSWFRLDITDDHLECSKDRGPSERSRLSLPTWNGGKDDALRLRCQVIVLNSSNHQLDCLLLLAPHRQL